ncbi:MAG: endonuclease/exonuclease/phosphatase family protein [Bacteroidales bacterium]|nr:endonuclease/exonuclease/phosphatase family protein [Bacteroidales bacterium]
MVKKSNAKPKIVKTSIPTKLMIFVNIVFAFLLICSYIAARVSPADFWPLAFAGLSYPFLLIINLFFVLFWIVFLKRYFLISLICILLGYNQFHSFIQFRGASEKILEKDGLKIMSYNVRLFDLYNWKDTKLVSRSRDGIFELIGNENADILCLQEYYNGKMYAETIKSKLNANYHYEAYIDNGKKLLPFGLITFSKYPIISSQKICYLNTYRNFCIITDIALPHDTVRVINTHMESIRFGKEDYLFVNDITRNSVKNNDFTQGSKSILSKMKNAFIKRSVQVDELSALISNSPYKVILCADFNDTPTSYVYRQIAKTHTDTFKAAGTGLGQTYAQILPILRIDYIFTDRTFKVLDYKTIHNEYSDHYPIITTISTREE